MHRGLWRIGLVLGILCGGAAAQSIETVVYSFGGYENDGAGPTGGVLFDKSGNIFGVTPTGGMFCTQDSGCGTVFELSPSATGWTEQVLYNFCTTGNQYTCPDGSLPYAGLISDSSGNLYGTTTYGGTGTYGTVFRLSPPPNGIGAWTENVLWNFERGKKNNGGSPEYGRLNMDATGNLYGTTGFGGASGVGTVFELSPTGTGTYDFSILHSFAGPDGSHPGYGVAIDKSGNLYGTTCYGGPANSGVVYELTQANGAWTETVLYHFNGKSGANPLSSISFDEAGNLYGTFENAGIGDCALGACGGVFKLVTQSGINDQEYSYQFDGQDGGNPPAGVLVDAGTGSVFGTSWNGGPGNVFQLRGRTENVLYQFCSLPDCSDGRYPSFGTIVEHSEQLYGETGSGGVYDEGVVYSISK